MTPDEQQAALTGERRWTATMQRCDGGSYCEEASDQFKKAQKVRNAYRALADALLEYERSGYTIT